MHELKAAWRTKMAKALECYFDSWEWSTHCMEWEIMSTVKKFMRYTNLSSFLVLKVPEKVSLSCEVFLGVFNMVSLFER